jgi:hypothetical protein
MSFHPYSRHDSTNSHAPLPPAPLTSDTSPLSNSYTDLTCDGRSVPEEPSTLHKVHETYRGVSSQRNTQPIDNKFQGMVNGCWPDGPINDDTLINDCLPPPSPPDIPYVPSSIGDEPMNDDTLINDSSLPLTPDNPYVPSPPNGYSDLTHFPDLEMDNGYFYTFPKVCEAYQTDRNELVETTESFIDDTFLNNTNNEPTDQAYQYGFNEPMNDDTFQSGTYYEPTDQAYQYGFNEPMNDDTFQSGTYYEPTDQAYQYGFNEPMNDDTFQSGTYYEPTDQAYQYGFNEPMTYWGPSQPYSSSSPSNMPVMVSSGIPQTSATSSISKNSEEVSSNGGSLPKKPKHSPEGEGPVSVFQVSRPMPTKEENIFNEKVRKFLNAHATDGENKKSENLRELRQMAQEYGKNIHNINETHIQDFLIMMACLRGINTRPAWSGDYYDQIQYLVTAMGFGVGLPDPKNYQTQAEKNNLLGRIISLTNGLGARLCSIEKTSGEQNENNRKLIDELKTTIQSFKEIKKKVLSQITIVTNQSWRTEVFAKPLRCLKDKLLDYNIKFTLKEGQPPLISLLQLMLLLPPPFQHTRNFSVEGLARLRDYILDYLRAFKKESGVFLFQSDNPELDRWLHKEFFERLLKKEEWLLLKAGASPEQIDAAKEEMKRLLQTTSDTDHEPTDQACQYGFNEPMTHGEPPQPSSPSNMPVMVSSGILRTSATSSISNRNTKNQKRAASDRSTRKEKRADPDSEEASSNGGSLPKKPKYSPEGEGPVSVFQALRSTHTIEENMFNDELRTFLKAHATDNENQKDENLKTLRQMAQEYGRNIHNIKETHIQDLLIMKACLRGVSNWSVPEEEKCYDQIEYLVTAMGFGLKLPSPTNHKTQAEKNDLLGCMINLRNGLETRLRKIKKISGTQSEKNCKLTEELTTTIQSFKEIQAEVRSQITIVTNQSWRVDVFNASFWCLKKKLKKRKIEFNFPEGQPQLNNLLELMLLLPTPRPSRKVSKKGLARLRDYPSDYLRFFKKNSGVLVFQSDYPEIDMELRTKYFDRLLKREEELRRAAGASEARIATTRKELESLLQTTPEI